MNDHVSASAKRNWVFVESVLFFNFLKIQFVCPQNLQHQHVKHPGIREFASDSMICTQWNHFGARSEFDLRCGRTPPSGSSRFVAMGAGASVEENRKVNCVVVGLFYGNNWGMCITIEKTINYVMVCCQKQQCQMFPIVSNDPYQFCLLEVCSQQPWLFGLNLWVWEWCALFLPIWKPECNVGTLEPCNPGTLEPASGLNKLGSFLLT